MPIKRIAPSPRLSPEQRQLLIDGPYKHGKTLADCPPHAVLCEWWKAEGAVLSAEHRCWFEERLWFVNQIPR